MNDLPPALLLISWKRSAYLEKTLANLLADPADFRVYWWDNASEDERTRELFETTQDERIVWKHRNAQNVGQREPCLWFFENAESDIVGKIDDDILLPHGWTDRITPMLRADPRFGMLGCWIFMPQEWNEMQALHSIVDVNGYRVFQSVTRAGQSFLARKDILRQYILPPNQTYGFPVDQKQMSLDGYINGFPVPPLMAHNMDDPASPHFVCAPDGSLIGASALTARKRGFIQREEYSEWIRSDAKKKLDCNFSRALTDLRRRENESWICRPVSRLRAMLKRLR